MMSRFVKRGNTLFNQENKELVNKKLGENEAVEHISTYQVNLDLFFQLVRSLKQEAIDSSIEKIILSNNQQNIMDLFIILFQTRNCRGGKGEKNLFYFMFLKLYQYFPKTIMMLIPLIPKYGYYKDFWNILEIIKVDSVINAKLINSLLSAYSKQLKADFEVIKNKVSGNNSESITFAGKYAPRESHKFHKKHPLLFEKFVKEYCFPNIPQDHALKLYREMNVALNKELKVPEVLMCSKSYSLINYSAMPSVCLNKFRKAFLNELIKKKGREVMNEETGDRFPNDEDRIQSRKRLRESIKKDKVSGKQLMPHEIVSKISDHPSATLSTAEKELFEAQWKSIRENIEMTLQNKSNEGGLSSGINLGKLVPLVDVSGSMNGTPMEVAIALGILVSEMNNPKFRDCFITFSQTPEWVSFQPNATLFEKVLQTRNAPWGGNTNFYAALKMILEIVKTEKLPAEEIPDLIVFSDMQFDVADNTFSTQYEILCSEFKKVGEDICGQGYNPPKIIFWNLRATVGYPVENDTLNVQMLSGFNPSLFKYVVSGEELIVPNTESTVVTPYETYCKMINDEIYDDIRLILSKSTEGILADYSFVREEKESSSCGMNIPSDDEITINNVNDQTADVAPK